VAFACPATADGEPHERIGRALAFGDLDEAAQRWTVAATRSAAQSPAAQGAPPPLGTDDFPQLDVNTGPTNGVIYANPPFQLSDADLKALLRRTQVEPSERED
jgi:hypothetical protein